MRQSAPIKQLVMSETKISIRELGDGFFCNAMEEFVKSQPYWAFIPMTAFIEFMGKCLNNRLESKKNTSTKDFEDAMKCSKLGLKKYLGKEEGEDNYPIDLYHWLRCGMVHSLMPSGKIKLAPEENDLDNCVIGAANLYGDIKKAWEELKKADEFKQMENPGIEIIVTDGLSGTTQLFEYETIYNPQK